MPETLSATLRELAQQTAERRERWLQQCAASTPTLYAALQPFLAELREASWHEPAEPAPPPLASDDAGQVAGHATRPLIPGCLLGPWRLEAEIGRGGMGVVWRAHRADGRFERQVAVKLLPALGADATLRARFLRETQALARLTHPHIAALLDAGQTDDGTAWLVMELVSGQSLLHHLRSHDCDLRSRVGWMVQLAEAVAHAHRHLLVHRDLKPGNVMVDAQGQVKLLDFGVTKLLDDAGSEPLTREIGGFTPGYASPEQVQGGTVTTLSDVFSLGVMLHELLTNEPPFLRPGGTLHEALHRTLNEEVPPPSRAPRALPGVDADLDAITQRALAKTEGERLPGADALAADLRAWLEGRPVSARAPSWAERSWKWVRRNRLLSATAALGLAGTLGFAASAQWAAQAAQAQAELAQHRLQQVRSFAGKVIHDYNGLLENLPGSIPARERLVSDALAYLDAMANEPGGQSDAGLRRELASAYMAIGNVQGRGLAGPGLGRFDAALTSFLRAETLIQPLVERPGAPPAERAEDMLTWAQAHEARAQVLAVQGQFDGARELVLSGLNQLRQVPLADLPPAARRLHDRLVASVLSALSSLESRGSGEVWALALPHARDYLAISRSQLQQLEGEGQGAETEALTQARLQVGFAADLLAFQGIAHGRFAEGLTLIEPVVAQARAFSQRKDHRGMQILLGTSTQTEGELRLLADQPQGGLARLREAAQLAEAMFRQEPENTEAHHGHLMSAWRLARGQRRIGQPAAALETTRRALRDAGAPGDLAPFLKGQVLRLETELALAWLALGQPERALAPAQRAHLGFLASAPPSQGASRRHLDGATAALALAMAQGAQPAGRAAAARLWQDAHSRLTAWLALTPGDLEAQAQLWRLCRYAAAQPRWLKLDAATLAQAEHSARSALAALRTLPASPEAGRTPVPSATADPPLPRIWRDPV